MNQQHISGDCVHSLLLWIHLHFPWLLTQQRFLRGLFVIVGDEMKRKEAAERGRWLHTMKRQLWPCTNGNDHVDIRKNVSAWLLTWPGMFDMPLFCEEFTQLACAMIEQSVGQAVRRRDDNDEGYKSAVREATQKERRRWLRRVNRLSSQ